MWSPSRRLFLTGLAALPLAATALRGWAEDVPELPQIKEAGITRDPNGVARMTLTAAPQADTAVANLLAYDGQFPGPLIRVFAGERLEISFRNKTDDPSNLHFHGLEVSPGGHSDNPFLEVSGGGTLEYALDISPRQRGLHWYHPHVHGQAAITAAAQMRGLVGPILITDPQGEPDLPDHLDRIVVLHDRDIVDGQVAKAGLTDWTIGHEGARLTVNGLPSARITCDAPWLRLRIVNTSNARYWQLAASDGRPIWRIAQDGPCLASPERLDELLLPPGSRAEIMLPVAGLPDFDLVYGNYARQGKVHVPAFALLQIKGTGLNRVLPSLPADLPAPDAMPMHRAVRTREIPIGLMTICTRKYEPTVDDFEAQLGDVERWILVNTDLMDHPMHLHTWRFEPIALNDEPVKGPRRSIDTVNLRPGDRMELGVHFARNPGRSLFHCHIVEHANQGMMSTVRVAS